MKYTAPYQLKINFPLWYLKNIVPISCFQQNDATIVITKNILVNYTTIQRGTQSKTFKGIMFDSMSFDNIKNRLFVQNGTEILQMNLADLDALWKFPGIFGKKELGMKSIKKFNFDKFFAINDHFFLIKDNITMICPIYNCHPQQIQIAFSLPFSLYHVPTQIEKSTFTEIHLLWLLISLNIPAILLNIYFHRRNQPRYHEIPLINLPRHTEIFTSV